LQVALQQAAAWLFHQLLLLLLLLRARCLSQQLHDAAICH
jgi:hypothetical protein